MARFTPALFVFLLFSTSFLPLVQATSSSSLATTSMSISGPYAGSLNDGASVFTSTNPTFSLSVSNPNNSTIYYTQYQITSDNATLFGNYSSPVTVQSNHSSQHVVRYRTNSSAGLEPWRSITMNVDADPPTLALSTHNRPPVQMVNNASRLVISPWNPLNVSCSDELSGVSIVQLNDGTNVYNSTSGVMTYTNASFDNAGALNDSILLSISCTDAVGNQVSMTKTVHLDTQPPILQTSESGLRYNNCVDQQWQLSASSVDNHTASSVEQQMGGAWFESQSPISPSQNQTIFYLRAKDLSGWTSTSQQWNLTVDSTPPTVNASLNATTLTVALEDNCLTSGFRLYWETYDGQSTGWTTYLSNLSSLSTPFNGKVVRANIQAFDVFNNTKSHQTDWVNTNNSMPYSILSVASSQIGQFIGNNFSATLTPLGLQSNVSAFVHVNGIRILSNNSTSQININLQLNHSDVVVIYHNTTNTWGGGVCRQRNLHGGQFQRSRPSHQCHRSTPQPHLAPAWVDRTARSLQSIGRHHRCRRQPCCVHFGRVHLVTIAGERLPRPLHLAWGRPEFRLRVPKRRPSRQRRAYHLAQRLGGPRSTQPFAPTSRR